MQVIPIKTDRVEMNPDKSIESWVNDSLSKNNQELQEGDILVMSSKVLSFFERRVVDLSTISPSEEAKKSLATEDCGAELVQLVLEEADEIIKDTKWVLLTRNNGIYCANAGIDKRNVPKGHVILWPKDPFESARKIRKELMGKKSLQKFSTIISDSVCIPGRYGSLAVAIGYDGLQGFHNLKDHEDLFGNTYRYTGLNIVDSLASTANTVMGESSDLQPLVIIRDYTWEQKEETKNGEMIIPPSDDMFVLR